ncbi:uncharacterized protein LOC135096730 [Scylla paramamosain]|uniref:uncharacterized protein LOC135096730 n=1 Tax=Scylla paramamosain TaxID=85552 RepID=UPI0030835FE5
MRRREQKRTRGQVPASAHRVFSEALWPPHNSGLSPAQGREGEGKGRTTTEESGKEEDRNKRRKGGCGHAQENEACGEQRTLGKPRTGQSKDLSFIPPSLPASPSTSRPSPGSPRPSRDSLKGLASGRSPPSLLRLLHALGPPRLGIKTPHHHTATPPHDPGRAARRQLPQDAQVKPKPPRSPPTLIQPLSPAPTLTAPLLSSQDPPSPSPQSLSPARPTLTQPLSPVLTLTDLSPALKIHSAPLPSPNTHSPSPQLAQHSPSPFPQSQHLHSLSPAPKTHPAPLPSPQHTGLLLASVDHRSLQQTSGLPSAQTTPPPHTRLVLTSVL